MITSDFVEVSRTLICELHWQAVRSTTIIGHFLARSSSNNERSPVAIRLEGPWKGGWALDWHTQSSTLRADGGFDTVRGELGQALYDLKYCGDIDRAETLAAAASTHIEQLLARPYLDGMVPVPPSDLTRKSQPVLDVARRVADKIGLPLHEDYLLKVKQTQALKALDDADERREQLAGAFRVADQRFAGRRVLLFDDLYRSGATLGEITRTLMNEGGVDRVYVLTLTRTRVKR